MTGVIIKVVAGVVASYASAMLGFIRDNPNLIYTWYVAAKINHQRIKNTSSLWNFAAWSNFPDYIELEVSEPITHDNSKKLEIINSEIINV